MKLHVPTKYVLPMGVLGLVLVSAAAAQSGGASQLTNQGSSGSNHMTVSTSLSGESSSGGSFGRSDGSQPVKPDVTVNGQPVNVDPNSSTQVTTPDGQAEISVSESNESQTTPTNVVTTSNSDGTVNVTSSSTSQNKNSSSFANINDWSNSHNTSQSTSSVSHTGTGNVSVSK